MFTRNNFDILFGDAQVPGKDFNHGFIRFSIHRGRCHFDLERVPFDSYDLIPGGPWNHLDPDLRMQLFSNGFSCFFHVLLFRERDPCPGETAAGPNSGSSFVGPPNIYVEFSRTLG